MKPCHTLTDGEVARAYDIAWARQMSAEERRRRPAHGSKENDPIGTHLIGVIGELAAHIYTGLAWNEFRTNLYPKPPDLEPDVEVRSVDRCDKRLILHEDDDPNYRAILAEIRGRKVRLIGWTNVNEARRETYLQSPANNGRFAFYVPRDALQPMDTFTKLSQ